MFSALLGYRGYRGFAGSSRVSGKIFWCWWGLSTYNNGHFALLLGLVVPPFYSTILPDILPPPGIYSCNFLGIAAVVLHWSVHMLVHRCWCVFPEAAAAPHFPAQSQPLSSPLSSCDLRFTSLVHDLLNISEALRHPSMLPPLIRGPPLGVEVTVGAAWRAQMWERPCLLYTSPSPRDGT